MNVLFERIAQAPGATVHFVKDRLSKAELVDAARIGKGEGALVQSGDRKLAVYRDDNDELHVMSPVCRHLKCIVDWNPDEKTWDCPCHGSRYDALGKVIHGPSTKDLLPETL
ncbi:MAG: Rieske 2Fe-2S domain-containing protein [Candidatus Geothermincolia bacterium]